jgi:hypothetical protein
MQPIYGVVGQCSAPFCGVRFSNLIAAFPVLGGGFVCEKHQEPPDPRSVDEKEQA